MDKVQSQQPEIKYNGQKLIGIARERFKQLLHKKWDWRSFYNGWIEGRSDMLQEIKGIKTELPQVEESKKELYYQQSVLNPYPLDSQSACAYKKGFYECYNIFQSQLPEIATDNQKDNDSDEKNAIAFAEFIELQNYHIKGMDDGQRAVIYNLFKQSKSLPPIQSKQL